MHVQVRQYKPKHFVFVHGMGGGAWFWFEIQTLLQQIGFNSTAVDLTSHGINKAIADNVTTVAEYSKPLIDAIAEIPGEVQLLDNISAIFNMTQARGDPVSVDCHAFPRYISENNLFATII